METSPFGFGPAFDGLTRRGCVECPATPLACPVCPSGEVCIQVSQTCAECPSRKCVPQAQSGATTQMTTQTDDSGPNVGAIAGGVVGGVLLIAGVVGCIYWFWIRRARLARQDYDRYSEKSDGKYGPSGRAGSAYTRNSMASTVRTRGSNVIQIAFIPGVTNRTDDGFTPPVPPIPSSQPQSPFTDSSGDHYFMPGDLRDSTYSGFTDDGASTIDRRSIAGRSIAPSIAPSLLRQSIASTVYHEDAVTNPMPAQTARLGRANVVSVKSSATPSRTPSVPAVPRIDMDKYGDPRGAGPSSATTAPAVMAGGLGLLSVNPPASSGASVVSVPSIPSIQVTCDSASERSYAASMHSASPDVKGAIERATMRASQQPTHGGLGSVRSTTQGDPSPFADSNRLADEPEGD